MSEYSIPASYPNLDFSSSFCRGNGNETRSFPVLSTARNKTRSLVACSASLRLSRASVRLMSARVLVADSARHLARRVALGGLVMGLNCPMSKSDQEEVFDTVFHQEQPC